VDRTGCVRVGDGQGSAEESLEFRAVSNSPLTLRISACAGGRWKALCLFATSFCERSLVGRSGWESMGGQEDSIGVYLLLGFRQWMRSLCFALCAVDKGTKWYALRCEASNKEEGQPMSPRSKRH
jgi:hypothetical protein